MVPPKARAVPETPFGQRLRAARKMAGLSMEDLAGKLGGIVTRQAIAKYETGRMMPSPEVLEKLVEVLKSATWGASPLRLTAADRDEAAGIPGDLLFVSDVPQGPKFRRARLLARWRGRGRVLLQESPGSLQVGQACPLDEADQIGPPRAPAGSPARGAADEDLVMLSIPGEGELPALAARRARFIREWAGDQGRNMIRFREGGKLPAKTETALKYRIADHLQKCLEIESLLGDEAPFTDPLAGRPTASREEVEAAAAEVRARWDLGAGPIVNLLGLLEDRGIKVYETRGLEGFEGLSGRFGQVPFVAVAMEYPPDRVRFTAAHELGHLLCDLAGREDTEKECHSFGAAFLLPRSAVEKLFRPAGRKVTLADLGEIKETYGISLQAVMHRAHSLGFVGDRQLRSFREALKTKGWLVEEPVAYQGRERATRFRRLLRYAVAADIIDRVRAAELAGIGVEELEKEIGEIF